ncbi:hypothetical protein CRM22_001679 [Opisthorchis felineus]|uniref:Uncharacterized protein n=1 Tax=Opisthorchis felineus TaxID=147828 RepID=A0A4S2MFF7_OPIFE|nr:hypothetical protein CRM22_001679 [Opisthorchis felineus]
MKTIEITKVTEPTTDKIPLEDDGMKSGITHDSQLPKCEPQHTGYEGRARLTKEIQVDLLEKVVVSHDTVVAWPIRLSSMCIFEQQNNESPHHDQEPSRQTYPYQTEQRVTATSPIPTLSMSFQVGNLAKSPLFNHGPGINIQTWVQFDNSSPECNLLVENRVSPVPLGELGVVSPTGTPKAKSSPDKENVARQWQVTTNGRFQTNLVDSPVGKTGVPDEIKDDVHKFSPVPDNMAQPQANQTQSIVIREWSSGLESVPKQEGAAVNQAVPASTESRKYDSPTLMNEQKQTLEKKLSEPPTAQDGSLVEIIGSQTITREQTLQEAIGSVCAGPEPTNLTVGEVKVSDISVEQTKSVALQELEKQASGIGGLEQIQPQTNSGMSFQIMTKLDVTEDTQMELTAHVSRPKNTMMVQTPRLAMAAESCKEPEVVQSEILPDQVEVNADQSAVKSKENQVENDPVFTSQSGIEQMVTGQLNILSSQNDHPESFVGKLEEASGGQQVGEKEEVPVELSEEPPVYDTEPFVGKPEEVSKGQQVEGQNEVRAEFSGGPPLYGTEERLGATFAPSGLTYEKKLESSDAKFDESEVQSPRQSYEDHSALDGIPLAETKEEVWTAIPGVQPVLAEEVPGVTSSVMQASEAGGESDHQKSGQSGMESRNQTYEEHNSLPGSQIVEEGEKKKDKDAMVHEAIPTTPDEEIQADDGQADEPDKRSDRIGLEENDEHARKQSHEDKRAEDSTFLYEEAAKRLSGYIVGKMLTMRLTSSAENELAEEPGASESSTAPPYPLGQVATTSFESPSEREIIPQKPFIHQPESDRNQECNPQPQTRDVEVDTEFIGAPVAKDQLEGHEDSEWSHSLHHYRHRRRHHYRGLSGEKALRQTDLELPYGTNKRHHSTSRLKCGTVKPHSGKQRPARPTTATGVQEGVLSICEMCGTPRAPSELDYPEKVSLERPGFEDRSDDTCSTTRTFSETSELQKVTMTLLNTLTTTAELLRNQYKRQRAAMKRYRARNQRSTSREPRSDLVHSESKLIQDKEMSYVKNTSCAEPYSPTNRLFNSIPCITKQQLHWCLRNTGQKMRSNTRVCSNDNEENHAVMRGWTNAECSTVRCGNPTLLPNRRRANSNALDVQGNEYCQNFSTTIDWRRRQTEAKLQFYDELSSPIAENYVPQTMRHDSATHPKLHSTCPANPWYSDRTDQHEVNKPIARTGARSRTTMAPNLSAEGFCRKSTEVNVRPKPTMLFPDEKRQHLPVSLTSTLDIPFPVETSQSKLSLSSTSKANSIPVTGQTPINYRCGFRTRVEKSSGENHHGNVAESHVVRGCLASPSTCRKTVPPTLIDYGFEFSSPRDVHQNEQLRTNQSTSVVDETESISFSSSHVLSSNETISMAQKQMRDRHEDSDAAIPGDICDSESSSGLSTVGLGMQGQKSSAVFNAELSDLIQRTVSQSGNEND